MYGADTVAASVVPKYVASVAFNAARVFGATGVALRRDTSCRPCCLQEARNDRPHAAERRADDPPRVRSRRRRSWAFRNRPRRRASRRAARSSASVAFFANVSLAANDVARDHVGPNQGPVQAPGLDDRLLPKTVSESGEGCRTRGDGAEDSPPTSPAPDPLPTPRCVPERIEAPLTSATPFIDPVA